MAEPYLALITPLTGEPSHPIVIPPGSPPSVWPGPGVSHPIMLPGAPPGAPGSPSHPIYITGNPEHPIYVPGYPDYGLPIGGSPSHPIVGFPDQGLPLPPGGSPVPPEVWPTPPGDYANKIIVAVHRPGEDWEVKAYPVAPAHPIPPGVSHPIQPPSGPAPSPRR